MKKINVEKLSIEQRIGQMLLARNPITQRDFDFIVDLVKNNALGGIHLSHKYVSDNYFVKSERVFIDKILEVADYPILICEDMENGFPDGEVSLPYQIALGSADDEELAYQYGRITAIEAKRAGYNTVFGPIVDIALNPESCCVGARSFGGNKELVARMAAATIKGYQDQGMIVTAKHFPGFGESKVDSHMGMVELAGNENSLLENELYPYRYTMEKADLTGIMVGHIMVPNIDPVYPASISPKLIGMLRQTGFDGLVMTDSFAMIGMTSRFPIEQCHKLAMTAGNDMVMTSYRTSGEKAYGYLMEAYKAGMTTDEQIFEAVRRVSNAQQRTLKYSGQSKIGSNEFVFAERMAEKSIACRCSPGEQPSIRKETKHLFIIQEGIYYHDQHTGKIKQDDCKIDYAVNTLKEEFPFSDFLYLPEFPVKQQIENILVRSVNYDSVVFVLWNRSMSYTGSSDATKRMTTIIDSIREKASILLFGNPYAAREFGEIKRIIFGFDGDQCQKYASWTLSGKHHPTGNLPIEL